MRQIETEVLIIGGGCTGVGVLYDLALRGVDAVLVDRGELAGGTTGRFHGQLHSGARYAVIDPPSARECREESEILRRVAGPCIEDRGGFFVETPFDDPGYAEQLQAGCAAAGITCDELSVAEALREEPRLHPGVRRVFAVPDAAIDPLGLVWACADAAQQYGARVLADHRVNDLVIESNRVAGARCFAASAGEECEVRATITVNAAGAWAGRIAALAACRVELVAGKGVLVAVGERLAHRVLSRCRPPGDGDILVSIGGVTIAGTTDDPVPDPETTQVAAGEVDRVLDEGARLVPDLRSVPVWRVWAGIRPLFAEGRGVSTADRDVSRGHHLLDHGWRDGVDGFLTITGGKLTVFRKMAQVTADLACQRLGIDARCRTATEMLPAPGLGRQRWPEGLTIGSLPHGPARGLR